jgi:hypothetical protein
LLRTFDDEFLLHWGSVEVFNLIKESIISIPIIFIIKWFYGWTAERS